MNLNALFWARCKCYDGCCTMAGYFSFRGRTGTVFISALCEMLQHYDTCDLMHILTRVNCEVAYFFEALVSRDNPNYHIFMYKKQMPTIVSMLTKDLYFVPKLSLKKSYCEMSDVKHVQ